MQRSTGRMIWICAAIGAIVAAGARPAGAAPLTIDVPLLATAPVMDGQGFAAEYGSGLDVRFNDAANPGLLFLFGSNPTLAPEQLSFTMYAGFTATDLYLAFDVTNPEVPGQGVDPLQPYLNDGVEVFIAGTPGASSFTPPNRVGSKEAFQLIADRFGNTSTVAGGEFTDADWQAAVTSTATGFGVEFRIPLNLILTPSGIAGAGSILNFNAAVNDNSGPTPGFMDQGILWAPDDRESPYRAGISSWAVELNLVPEPSSWLMLGLGGAGLLAAIRRRRAA